MKYYIITMSKAHHEITQEQKEALMKVDASQVELSDGSVVKINSIAEIMPESKYFQTFPDKRPEETRNDFEENYSNYNKQVRQPTTRARELMQEGFVKQQMNAHNISKEEATKRFNDFINRKSLVKSM